MSSILTSSIFLLFFSSEILVAQTLNKVSQRKGQVPEATKVRTVMAEVGFLEQGEDVEREAWWVLTGSRSTGAGSPFRVMRAAFLMQKNLQNKNQTVKLNLSGCKKLKVVELIKGRLWRVDSECQKAPVEMGTLQKLTPETWKLQWSMAAFSPHFGLGSSILYTKSGCELKVTPQGRLSEMRCPQYVRNRNESEIVELSEFEYRAGQSSLLKLKGEVKKDLEKVATIETTVPLTGEIIVKEKQIPSQKPVEESAEFSDSKKAPQPGQEKINGSKKANENPENNPENPKASDEKGDEKNSQNSGEESENPENPTEPLSETPPISEPPPTR